MKLASWHDNLASPSHLQEHDYIGLSPAPPSPPPPPPPPPPPLPLHFDDTDLRLGLALPPSKNAEPPSSLHKSLSLSLPPPSPPSLNTSPSSPPVLGTSTPTLHEEHRFLQVAFRQTRPSLEAIQACATGPVQDYGAPRGAPRLVTPQLCVAKMNGTKRAYNDTTMATDAAAAAAARFTDQSPMACKNVGEAGGVGVNCGENVVFMGNWAGAPPASSSSISKPHHALPAPPPPPWASSAREPASSAAAFPPESSVQPPPPPSQSVANEPPPAKDRVVGWPPIGSYRRSTLVKPSDMFAKVNIHDGVVKPSEMFVKVNMDGVTVGRKVDLNAHASYEGLLLALEEMFQPSNTGTSQNDAKHFRLLNGSDYVLTYEDKDGDWMLVGDVPWSMFTSTVRRLRIQRGTDATGLAPRASEKAK